MGVLAPEGSSLTKLKKEEKHKLKKKKNRKSSKRTEKRRRKKTWEVFSDDSDDSSAALIRGVRMRCEESELFKVFKTSGFLSCTHISSLLTEGKKERHREGGGVSPDVRSQSLIAIGHRHHVEATAKGAGGGESHGLTVFRFEYIKTVRF